MKEEQGKKISPVVSDAAVKEVIPAKPDKPTELSDEDLDKVAGGLKIVEIKGDQSPDAHSYIGTVTLVR